MKFGIGSEHETTGPYCILKKLKTSGNKKVTKVTSRLGKEIILKVLKRNIFPSSDTQFNDQEKDREHRTKKLAFKNLKENENKTGVLKSHLGHTLKDSSFKYPNSDQCQYSLSPEEQ